MILTLVLISAIASPGSAREWTDSTGKFSTEAEFVEIQGTSVILKNTDGKTVTVPIARANLKVRRGGRCGTRADSCRASMHVNYALSKEVTSGFRVVMTKTTIRL